jgi:hypothetical protein
MALKLIREGGLIYAPVENWDAEAKTLLCERVGIDDAAIPDGPGEDLNRCLYSLRNCNEEVGRLPDGTTVELDGVIVGHFESVHFMPSKP